MTAAVGTNSVWSRLAQSYALLGPPLRPGPDDLRLMEREVARHRARHPRARTTALLLGVTPGVARMQWPAGTHLIGVDNTWAMIRGIWPGDVPAARNVVCGDWLTPPLPPGSCDVVVGDGSIISLRWPDGLRALANSMRSVLRDDGRIILRCYIQPGRKERPHDVFDDLFRGAIATFDLFKLRLAMAMQQDSRAGIVIAEVYERWAHDARDRCAPLCQARWGTRVFERIDYYEGSETVYTFPTLSEFRAVMLDFFDEVSLIAPPSPWGGLCPVFVLEPRPSGS
jgi:SAM-dependent methyltransferase